MKKRLLYALCAACAVLCLTGCGFLSSMLVEDVEMTADTVEAADGTQPYDDDSWVIYWYHCGSDLETNYGCASEDLQEMMSVQLPDNVQVIVQTGGSKEWHNSQVDASKVQRYLYDSKGLHLIDEQPKANMGDPDTLEDFLRFSYARYPAARRMVVFWNHGGGSVGGAAYDQNYRYDSLTLDEFYQAFDSALELSVDNPPFDIVGFDTCLMATIDTAYTFADVARYLVASEESEPGCGWYYKGWLQALADNPGMDPAELGCVVCDTFAEGCEIDECADEITLSVTDLSAINPLMEAYEALGQEALLNAVENPGFFSSFGRCAQKAENYGGNTDDTGYTNMVDLGDLARKSEDLLPESAAAVQEALDNTVIYRINGPYRKQATGLSCYYSYDGDEDDLSGYANISACEAFTWLYGYEVGGNLDDRGMNYLNGIGWKGTPVPDVRTLKSVPEEEQDYPVTISYTADNGDEAVLDVGGDVAEMLRGVYFMLAYIDEESDAVLLLGTDNEMAQDWENGVFTSAFHGYWGALDGHLAYMEIVQEGDGYDTYSIPILLNGEKYHLRVTFDYDDGEYHILGARRELEENGMMDKYLRKIESGDEITMIHYGATFSSDDAFEAYEADKFTATEDTSFNIVGIGDGEYAMLFQLVDVQNNNAWSQPILVTVTDGEVTMET